MSEKKPVPLVASRSPRLCPVCKKASYSPNGIHPQCAISQADKPRADRLAAERKALAASQANNNASAAS